jgi:hypothetical protein
MFVLCFNFRVLRRHIETLERQKEDIQRECELIKERLYGHGGPPVGSASQRYHYAQPSDGAATQSVNKTAIDTSIKTVRFESQEARGPVQYPSVLDSSATDINDILAALGGGVNTAPATRSGDILDESGINSSSGLNSTASDSSSINAAVNSAAAASENRLKELIAAALAPSQPSTSGSNRLTAPNSTGRTPTSRW